MSNARARDASKVAEPATRAGGAERAQRHGDLVELELGKRADRAHGDAHRRAEQPPLGGERVAELVHARDRDRGQGEIEPHLRKAWAKRL
jgi:hypothetical protein